MVRGRHIHETEVGCTVTSIIRVTNEDGSVLGGMLSNSDEGTSTSEGEKDE
jgi:predicted thioesterase